MQQMTALAKCFALSKGYLLSTPLPCPKGGLTRHRHLPEQTLHAVVVACSGVFLCIAQELLVHALVEGVPQEVAPEAVQPVHLI